MSDQAIYISHLHKAYGPLHVLRGVDLEVMRGEIFGLLGPNGAGKTTLIHTMLGLLKPDNGTVRVFGADDRGQLSARVGFLPERPRYHGQFTGREYLRHLGRLSGLSGSQLHDRIDAVIELVGLGKSADRRIGTFSKGMLQRIGVAQAVLHNPDLLIVDEPASGLDPGGQREMAALLRTLGETGHTIFLCSHQLNDVAHLCDRVAVLVGGRIAALSTLTDLRAQGHSVTINVSDLSLETIGALQRLGPEVQCDRAAITLFPTSDALLTAVLRRLLDDGITVRSVIPEADALDQFYQRAVQQSLTNNARPAPQPETSEELLETLIEDR